MNDCFANCWSTGLWEFFRVVDVCRQVWQQKECGYWMNMLWTIVLQIVEVPTSGSSSELWKFVDKYGNTTRVVIEWSFYERLFCKLMKYWRVGVLPSCGSLSTSMPSQREWLLNDYVMNDYFTLLKKENPVRRTNMLRPKSLLRNM